MVEKAPPDPAFEALLRYIQESRGLDFLGYKRTTLKRRITLRMEALGAADFPSYQSQLEVDPGEFENLINTVLINVTSFFRDPEAWGVLRTNIIPLIIANARDDRPIRVWSVGCASGQEPYSLAILFAELMGTEECCRRVKIYATDLDEEALKVARLASYAPRDVEGMPPDLLERYFERTGDRHVFHRDLRKCVIFGRHNVVNDAPISRIDLLVCRNLLIYLEAETQNLVLPRLHYALTSDGFLFLGKAETQLARSALFRAVEMKHRIFAKAPQEWRRLAAGLSGGRPPRTDPMAMDGNLLEAVLNEAGNALVVVDHNGTVALANAPARHLLAIGEGDIGRPFQDLPISYRPIELRGPIDEVFLQRRNLRLEDQEYRLSQSEVLRLTIDLRPLFRGDGSMQAVLLSFRDTTHIQALQRELEAAQETLENSIEELQSANEELETTNEELQSANEELEATNEELQSTNEELETLNEEARSSNEEMEAVNEELRIQADQATSYRIYLESALRAMNGGIVVLDDKLHIRSWNRWSENNWGVRAEEAIDTSFETLDIGLPTHLLRDDMAAVLAGRQELAERVLEGLDRRGRRILCLVRTSGLVDEDGRNQGLVLVMQDVTKERRDEEHIRYLGRIIGRAYNEVYFLDPHDFRFTLTNAGAQRKLGYSEQQLGMMKLPDVMPAIDPRDLKALVEPLISGAEEEIVFETVLRASGGREYPAELCLQYLADEGRPIIVAMVHDTSQRRKLPVAAE